MKKQTILIADDTEVNRSLLSDILSDDYEIIEACDGREALQIIENQGIKVSLLLLDIVMPCMDGFEVLVQLQKHGWCDDIPVIIISAETSPAYIRKGFELGVSDYISRPFDPEVVLQRARNTIMLYSKQAQLKNLVAEQVRENEKNSTLMVDILSTVVEFRNGESGLHVMRIRIITEFFLEAIMRRYPEYGLSSTMIALISNAAALHDIGKLTVPEEILNKPGKLTPEEFESIKQHPIIGDEMLDSLHFGKQEELVRYAKQICRWHHERWDGKGYPDRLKGDDIPIAAQTVALADVYDALVSKRVYKPAYSHEKAVDMILRGECGCFNPILLQCLIEEAENLKKSVDLNSEQPLLSNVNQLSREVLARGGSGLSDRTLQLLERERIKYQFLASISNEILFDYDVETDMLTFSDRCKDEFDLPLTISDCKQSTILHHRFGPNNLKHLLLKIRKTKPASPIAREKFLFSGPDGSPQWYEIIMRSLWQDEQDTPSICGVIGRITNIHEDLMRTFTLQNMAYRDALTGLYNTSMAQQLVSKSLSSGENKICALLLFDLDHFKEANDTYGHLFGNEVLCSVAKGMEANIRQTDITARVGGDEFLIFLRNLHDQGELESQCARIFEHLQGNCGGYLYTLSMGIAVYPTQGETYDSLFRHADQALYTSKRYGRGRYTFYNESLQDFTSLISPIDSEKKPSDT